MIFEKTLLIELFFIRSRLNNFNLGKSNELVLLHTFTVIWPF
jgi:hypothetical protein